MARIFGEIPGYEEGSWFVDRAALNVAGVHRPLQAGICGSESEGAESIVLSGGYEDDEDHGDWIIYTGAGGNDPTTKRQVYSQELVRGNRALVRNLIDGLPVRVVRGAGHCSAYSPATGFSYDGLYRVEDYWCETGRSGFRIWRFRMTKSSVSSTKQVSSVREPKNAYGSEVPERSTVTVSRIIRSSVVVNAVKQMHDYTCQVCGVRLETPAGPYAEGAHIRPLGAPHGGPDTVDNVLCLCPNDHALFDLGAITIEDDLTVTGSNQKLRIVHGHSPNLDFLRYHRQLYGT
jgi:putative restriction endonuclease